MRVNLTRLHHVVARVRTLASFPRPRLVGPQFTDIWETVPRGRQLNEKRGKISGTSTMEWFPEEGKGGDKSTELSCDTQMSL